MPVYVDDLVAWDADVYRGPGAAQARRVGARYGHRWCHMFADESDCRELHAMARRIGMKRSWFQGDHYDLVPPRRAAAVRLGAITVDRKRAVEIWKQQRRQNSLRASKAPDHA